MGPSQWPDPEVSEQQRHATVDLVGYVSEGWKLIYGRRSAATELYDLHADPEEQQNLVDQQPARVRALGRLLVEHLEQL